MSYYENVCRFKRKKNRTDIKSIELQKSCIMFKAKKIDFDENCQDTE